jgi:hypothetical protein
MPADSVQDLDVSSIPSASYKRPPFLTTAGWERGGEKYPPRFPQGRVAWVLLFGRAGASALNRKEPPCISSARSCSA